MSVHFCKVLLTYNYEIKLIRNPRWEKPTGTASILYLFCILRNKSLLILNKKTDFFKLNPYSPLQNKIMHNNCIRNIEMIFSYTISRFYRRSVW